ncbi:DEAD/DEAH box helicase family protein [Tissierella praeacuta]|uniref:DEAD/DEAH box helicase family protein n=1 Tax=Tissierella praeacuta TaxID=43131 RepID=UPI002FD8FDCE
MMKSTINIDYFKELEEQIISEKLWNSEKFIVFDHEAGTGKSRYTQQLLGEMAQTKNHKVLYVQKFKKDDELVKTMERINYYAGRDIAGYYSSDMRREQKKKAKDIQILCITHQMYYQICKGNNLELIKGRDILIIDELPQLIQEIYVTRDDIASLWGRFNRDGDGAGRELAQLLLDLLLEIKENKGDGVKYIDFRVEKYDKFRKLYNRVKDSRDIQLKEEKEILGKIDMLLNQSFFVCQNRFVSWENGIELYKLKNNIILDANGGFDHRYKLSNQFEVKRQNKRYDYQNANLFHYNAKTTKGNLAKDRDKMHSNIVSRIDWNNLSKVLFITDIAGEQSLEKEILSYLRFYGTNLIEIQQNFNKVIAIDHFGNLIGRNHYRDFDTIVILKTPNYNYISYILDYTFLTGNVTDGMIFETFKNAEIEKIRISAVAGEFYQAIKRINRENKLSSNIYLFSDDMDAVEIIKGQLRNVQYFYKEIDFDKRTYNTANRPKTQLNKLKEILMRYKRDGIKEINKKSIKEELGVKSPNLAKLLSEVKDFAEKNNIRIEKGRKIIFN